MSNKEKSKSDNKKSKKDPSEVEIFSKDDQFMSEEMKKKVLKKFDDSKTKDKVKLLEKLASCIDLSEGNVLGSVKREDLKEHLKSLGRKKKEISDKSKPETNIKKEPKNKSGED